MLNTREIAAEYRLLHWAGIIRERNASGKSIRAYCESIGLHTNVYHYWQRKLREAACTELLPAPANDVEVARVPTGWATVQTSNRQMPVSSSGEITIEIGKSRVNVSKGVDMELLGNVCRMLASLC